VLNNSSPSFEPTLTQRISESRVLRIIALLVLLKMIGSAFYLHVQTQKVWASTEAGGLVKIAIVRSGFGAATEEPFIASL
jgi:hypothetical protein